MPILRGWLKKNYPQNKQASLTSSAWVLKRSASSLANLLRCSSIRKVPMERVIWNRSKTLVLGIENNKQSEIFDEIKTFRTEFIAFIWSRKMATTESQTRSLSHLVKGCCGILPILERPFGNYLNLKCRYWGVRNV